MCILLHLHLHHKVALSLGFPRSCRGHKDAHQCVYTSVLPTADGTSITPLRLCLLCQLGSLVGRVWHRAVPQEKLTRKGIFPFLFRNIGNKCFCRKLNPGDSMTWKRTQPECKCGIFVFNPSCPLSLISSLRETITDGKCLLFNKSLNHLAKWMWSEPKEP